MKTSTNGRRANQSTYPNPRTINEAIDAYKRAGALSGPQERAAALPIFAEEVGMPQREAKKIFHV
jgi:hypothetical protein